MEEGNERPVVEEVIDTNVLMESDDDVVENGSKTKGKNVICSYFTIGISLRLTYNDKYR